MDRRIKKTKNLIRQEVTRVYSSNRKVKLNVSSLCESIDINRSTFYLHYNCIEDVIEEIEKEIVEDVKKICVDYRDNVTNALTEICIYVKQHNNEAKTIFNVSFSHFLNLVLREFYQLANDSWFVTSVEGNISKEYVTTFLIYGSLGVIKKWVFDDFKAPIEAIANGFHDFFKSKYKTK